MPEAGPDAKAAVRVTAAGGYAGDVSAADAWRMLARDAPATLVDVRTLAEWAYVGTPDLSSIGKRPLLIEWQTFPEQRLAPDFADKLQRACPDKGAPVLFLCRSGARSAAAAKAMTARGFTHCYNVADGFEGVANESGHRGGLQGWKAAGLPWVQT